jgi:hypothetical protein
LISSFRGKSVTGTIQGQVTVLNDDQLSKMFELEATLKRLKEDEKQMEEVVKEDPEEEFKEATGRFKI